MDADRELPFLEPLAQPASRVMTREVVHLPPGTPLLRLSAEMVRRRISCVPICEGLRPVGILSERDVVRLLANPSRPATGLRASDVMSRPVRTIHCEQSCSDVLEAMKRFQVRRLPVVDSSGSMVGLVTQTDLLRYSERELRQYSARLEEAVEEKTRRLAEVSSFKDELMGMVVHDLKNPLAVILGVLETTLEGRRRTVSDPRLRKRLSLALEASRSMLLMVLNLLDIAKIENGELKPERSSVTCRDLVQRAVAQNRELADRDDISIEIRRMPWNQSIEVDIQLLERVLQNLLSNAVKFSPAGQNVELEAWIENSVSPPRLVVSVTNWGKPIPAEYKEKIFDKFSQLEVKRSGNVTSTGLGLTFCKLAVEAHGGLIRVESPVAGTDRGARFLCLVPLQ